MKQQVRCNEAEMKAIGYNPPVEEEYRRVLEEDTKKELEVGIEKLSEKFKVTRK